MKMFEEEKEASIKGKKKMIKQSLKFTGKKDSKRMTYQKVNGNEGL